MQCNMPDHKESCVVKVDGISTTSNKKVLFIIINSYLYWDGYYVLE